MSTSPIRIHEVNEPWAQLRLSRAGGIAPCRLSGEMLGLRPFWLSAPQCARPGFPATTIGPLEEIALDPDNPEQIRIAKEAIDRAKGRSAVPC
jgi:hypothetical protein